MIRSAVIALIRGYQQWLSPLKIFFGASGGSCRFTPTCSEYAVQAVGEHGVAKGLFFGFYRILRCQPWGGQGYDPVPPKTSLGLRADHSCGCCPPSKHLENFHG
jgi:putative membrane protein insertion efficiency factor